MTSYEWVIETVDEYEDIVDVNHADSFRQALRVMASVSEELRPGHRIEIGLVRDQGDEVDGLQDRQWAYLEDGALPARFDGGKLVPKRFIEEVRKTKK